MARPLNTKTATAEQLKKRIAEVRKMVKQYPEDSCGELDMLIYLTELLKETWKRVIDEI